MAVTPDDVYEHTTALALEEKGKLKKSLRRVDMLLFTVCAMVGVDTLGQVSGFGAQTFFWVAILSVFFLLPYALVMSELGSSFTQEGGPYEWMKLSWGRLPAGVGAILYWVTNPLWVGGTLAFISTEACTATDVVTTVSEMLRAVNLNIFDLAMWFRRSR